MEAQKKFQKKSLNRDDYKGAERGTKAIKVALASICALALGVKNKDNIKDISVEVFNVVKGATKN